MFGFMRTVRRRSRRLRRRSKRQRGAGPNPYFKVKYGDVEVLGQTLPSAQSIPTVELMPNLDQSYYYTLIMDDPDAPTIKPFMHWMVINIRGSDFSSGTVVYDYYGPAPPSGKHRYNFRLYKQLLGVAPAPVLQGRGTYDKSRFIAEQQAQPIGQPIYFYVQA